MKRLAGPVALMLTLTAQACMSSTLLLHVRPDGSGQARISSRVFEPGIRAFDSLFLDVKAEAPTLEELLPAPSEGELERNFGTRVRLGSTSLQKAADGGVRVTVVDFEDVTKLRMSFPPVFSVPLGRSFSMSGLDDGAVVTFATKAHENGNRLLLVKLPDAELPADPNPQFTAVESNSNEELKLKRAIKGLTLRFSVEMEQPVLRTNAPASTATGATIFDLDLDRMVNAMDEAKVRRMLSRASLQDMLWQLGQLPGAVLAADREVFLEFEGPQAPAAPAAARPAVQAPPDTEIYLAPMTMANGAIELGRPINITSNPGYDNQPSFTPDGRAILFTSVRGGGTQTDIYKYDIASKQIAQVTNTPESEYSATVTPSGTMSVVRVELDEAKTQRLWRFDADGRNPRLVLENVKPVGYHAWSDDHTLALFVLGQPATLQLADTRSGVAMPLASDIGRSLQPIRGPQAAAGSISFVQRERRGDVTDLSIKELNPATRAIAVLTHAVPGATEADTAWTPDGTLLMVKGNTLYGWRRGQSGWKEIASLERLSLAGVTRLAVSPKGDYLALVAPSAQAR